ncbi:MAG TPA: UbiA family prenyltransferase [Candidatus Limnocylindrales bacterium]|nr:UbiA family prenyltransferase [Candidatus Limnocylindrales bacterium]
MRAFRRLEPVLVRWRAWWFNKVPLSLMLVLLLLDGRALTGAGNMVMLLVVVAVCAVGNYGYALNELFDVEEDARAGRSNAAAASGAVRMWAIIGLSALGALAAAAFAGGVAGAVMTVVELALPATYSIPPMRTKERRWLGIVSDAFAAHVYPALLALLAAAHWSLRPVGAPLVVLLTIWSAAAGLRGILSHQLHTHERDARAGLRTVVDDLGAGRLERLIVAVLLPLEAIAFGAALLLLDVGPVLAAGIAVYLLYEAYKTFSGRFRVAMFRPQGQPYLPFVEERFYKAWAPLIVALDAACVDLRFLLFVAAYALLFAPHLRDERERLAGVIRSLRAARAREPAVRSNGEA